MLPPKPWQPCNQQYVKFVRCQGEIALVRAGRDLFPVSCEDCGLQTVVTDATLHGVCCALLWRPYPCYSFLATHAKLMQDKPPPEAPAWYGQPRPGETGPLVLFAEDLDGKVQLAPTALPDALQTAPSGIVVAFSAGLDGSSGLSGLLAVDRNQQLLFPGGYEGDWAFEEMTQEHVAGASVSLICCVETAGVGVSSFFMGAFRRNGALRGDFPAGAVLVAGSQDPLPSKGFPLPPVPELMLRTAAPGCVAVGSPHLHEFAPGLSVLFQDGAAVDDVILAGARKDTDRRASHHQHRALLFAKAALLWRCLAPTAGDTLPCPTRRLADVTQPPWPADDASKLPVALILGPRQTEGDGDLAASGAVVLARHVPSGRTVVVVSLAEGACGSVSVSASPSGHLIAAGWRWGSP